MPHDHHNHDHDHGHHHGHDHHGHNHAPVVTDHNETRVFWVMIMTGLFMVTEAVGGYLSGSLALLADSGHMLADTAALTLAWLAFRMARKPADIKRSYGYHRFQILAAFANGLTLFLIAIWITKEAFVRLFNPVEIMGTPMLIIASLGLLVNIIGFIILSRGEQDNLNIKGAALHVLGDLLGSVAAIAAALIILATGWTPIDPISSVLVSLLILRGAWAIVAQSSHILLQGAPDGIDAARIGAALGGIEGVLDIHHVHAWSLTNEQPIVTLHAVLEKTANHEKILQRINDVLKEHFNIYHATVQLELGTSTCAQEIKE